jgi:LAO/AO transport system kinase
LIEKILAGDLRALARAATLIENHTEAGRELLNALRPHVGRARIVGITGPPGAGKSTLVDQITECLRRESERVGIVAIDASSPYSHGAILGDRIRMQRHHNDPGVFIRSMATRDQLGGIARGTRDLALLLDAAGFDTILIETVGVGQNEVEIARLANTTVLVLVPGFGDDIQAMKAGIMEIADVFALNKADLPGAERLEQEIRATQHAPVQRVIAATGAGVPELIALIRSQLQKKELTND